MKRLLGFFGKLFGWSLSGGGTGGVDGQDFADAQMAEWDREEEEGRREATE